MSLHKDKVALTSILYNNIMPNHIPFDKWISFNLLNQPFVSRLFVYLTLFVL